MIGAKIMTNNRTTQKNAKGHIHLFLYKIAKKREMVILAFCVINFEPIISKTFKAPQNDHQNLSFVKNNIHIVKKWPETVVQRSFL